MRLAEIVLVALALSVPALAACGADEPDPPPEPKFQLSIDDGEVRVSGRTDAGERYEVELGGDVGAPELPDDVPLYPGATPRGHVGAGGQGTVASFASDATTALIHEYYREELVDEGWELEADANVGGQRMLSATKGARRVSVAITGEGAGSRITLSASGG